jgi:hypothetical protein
MNNLNCNSICLDETNIYSGFNLNKIIVDGSPLADEIFIFDSSKPYEIKIVQFHIIKIKENRNKI